MPCCLLQHQHHTQQYPIQASNGGSGPTSIYGSLLIRRRRKACAIRRRRIFPQGDLNPNLPSAANLHFEWMVSFLDIVPGRLLHYHFRCRYDYHSIYTTDATIWWRGTLGVIGRFGVVSVAAAGLLLPSDGDRGRNNEPKEGALSDDNNTQNAEEEKSLVQNTLQLLSIPRVQFLFLASFVRFCLGLMIGVWAAP